jgi:hypothetical protein
MAPTVSSIGTSGQRVGQRILRRGRAGVVPDERARRIALPAELHLDEHALPADPAAQRVAQQQFVVAHAVEVPGVQQRDPGVQGRSDRRDALLVVRGAIDAGHAHQAEARAGHHRSAAP